MLNGGTSCQLSLCKSVSLTLWCVSLSLCVEVPSTAVLLAEYQRMVKGRLVAGFVPEVALRNARFEKNKKKKPTNLQQTESTSVTFTLEPQTKT